MKILIAIKSTGRAETVGDDALRIIGRTGFDYKLFVSPMEAEDYVTALAQANYDWYLALKEDIIETELSPENYARKHKYDLIVYVPDNMGRWHRDMDEEVPQFCKRMGISRLKFSQHPRKRVETMKKDVVMRRVQ